MAKFVQINEFFINPDQVLYIHGYSSSEGGEEDSCDLIFSNAQTIRLDAKAAVIASHLAGSRFKD